MFVLQTFRISREMWNIAQDIYLLLQIAKNTCFGRSSSSLREVELSALYNEPRMRAEDEDAWSTEGEYDKEEWETIFPLPSSQSYAPRETSCVSSGPAFSECGPQCDVLRVAS